MSHKLFWEGVPVVKSMYHKLLEVMDIFVALFMMVVLEVYTYL